MKRLRPHLTYSNIGVTVCLLIVTLALTPLGGVSANAADDLTTQVAKALKKSKAADKRSKQALKTAQAALDQGGPQGPAGPQGSQGPPGADGSPDSAAQVLAKLLTVDGAASLLDADQLDGLEASDFARSTSFRAGLVQTDGGMTLNTPGVTSSRNSMGDYRLDFGNFNSTCQLAVSVEEQFTFNRIRFIGGLDGWDVEIVDTTGAPIDALFDFVAVCRPTPNAPARPTVR